VRHSRRQQADAAQLIRLHQALLQFGAVRDVVDNDQSADLFLILRYQRRDRNVQRRVAQPARRGMPVAMSAAVGHRQGSGLQHEFVDVMDPGLAAHPVELL
jgi:hypothetical protein